MGQHVVVMAADKLVLRGKGRVRAAPATAQPVDHLHNKPGAAIAAAPDHQPVGTRLASARSASSSVVISPFAITGIDTASLTSRMKSPIGAAGIELTAGAAVHRNHANAA